MPERFSPKPPEELQKQIDAVSEEIGESIEQPTSRDDLLEMSLSEIKEKFPRRYEMYLQTLRADRRSDEVDEDEKKSMVTWLKALNSLDTYIENHKSNGEDRTLRDRQFSVFEELRDFLEQGGKDGYIKLPTGVGKTVLFIEFLEATNLKALIVAPTRILVDQTGERIEQFAEGLDVGKIHQTAKTKGRQVTITTYASLIRQIKQGVLNPKDYECLVLDEAHKALGPETQKAVEQFEHAFRIGFTATPDYSQDKKLSQLLPKEISRMRIIDAVEEDLLSSFSVVIAHTETDLSSVQIESNNEFNQKQLEKAINVEGRNKAAVELYQKMFDGQKCVTYCISIDHAEKVANLFQEKGISARVISGQNQNEHEEILEKYKTGEIKILCNANILIEGFDDPEASVCLNLRPTNSPVVAEQRSGRVLRLDPQNPEKHATIVDFFDKNLNPQHPPISFADIAGTAFVLPKRNLRKKDTEIDEQINATGLTSRQPEIQIDGLRVITDAREVMRIVNEAREQLIFEQKVVEYTHEELIQQLRNEFDRFGRAPTGRDIDEASKEKRTASSNTFRQAFGSWNKALKAAGLEVLHRRSYSKAELIQQLKDEFERLGRVPTTKDITSTSKENKTASSGTFQNVFGSWKKALEAAGLEVTWKRDYTKEELIQQLKYEFQRLGRVPVNMDIMSASKENRTAHPTTFYEIFGSWSKALEAAGLEIIHKRGYTKEGLIQQLNDEFGRLGKVPTAEDMKFASKENRTVSINTFRNFFGSWNKALEAAGLLKNKEDKNE